MHVLSWLTHFVEDYVNRKNEGLGVWQGSRPQHTELSGRTTWPHLTQSAPSYYGRSSDRTTPGQGVSPRSSPTDILGHMTTHQLLRHRLILSLIRPSPAWLHSCLLRLLSVTVDLSIEGISRSTWSGLILSWRNLHRSGHPSWARISPRRVQDLPRARYCTIRQWSLIRGLRGTATSPRE